ncbi:hypothetical protein RB623_08115 [Mesorhizobium sp. LHD-90]|uniref:hypothetical protein n=1 Tax=Mesorhizobium sp. LHD-90 TaxID=3071414 RepID=UPI0027E177E6|nr:hypothetical protein [Mesorhizobium sp. LHD-90]MDQ6434010.1 hypothetical protein [Mesorhizobium sp. LHD-90]
MTSKFFLPIAATLLFALPANAADEISLVGKWTGPRERIRQEEGWKEGLATLVITEQKGRTFTGHLVRANPSGDQTEPLWGAFTPGGRLIVAADEEGTYSFDLVDTKTLDFCYAESRPKAAAVCARLTRQP